MIFSLQRFISVVRFDIATHLRKTIISVLAMLSIVFVCDMAICISNHNVTVSNQIEELGNFNIFIFLASLLMVSSLAFHELGKNTGIVNMLMLPASTFEKWLSRWLLTVPVATIIILLILYICNMISSAIWCAYMSYPESVSISIIPYVKQINNFKYINLVALMQSAYFLGSLLWPNISWAKTTLAVTLFALLCVSMVISFETEVYRNVWGTGLPIALIIYIISYFRLKEDEIINRW